MTIIANTGLLAGGLVAVWAIPAFRADAHFWVPVIVAVQVWFHFFMRAGRNTSRPRARR
jgi:hypothetical protein